jgi:DNA polymerase-1
MSDRRLVLVDGTTVLYRAFFAIRELSTRSGLPTNAVFGFIRMLDQMRAVRAPTHWAVVFDGGLPQERTALWAAYKAQRPRMPGALRAQIAPVERYLAAANIASLRVEGQEADDVLASVAEWAKASVAEIVVATGDKDLYQIVDDRVRLVAVSGKGPAMDAEAVLQKTGVRPEQIVDWLALVGDATDNIPGVSGMGPKTAGKLLARYGSWEGLWANVSAVVPERLRVAVEEGRSEIERNRRLVRLRTDLGCPLTWDDMAVRSPTPGLLLPLYEELELDSLAAGLRERSLFPG